MDPIMLIQLTTNLSRLLKANLERLDNDASACYDRIMVALEMLAARRVGMPENAIKTHADALQFMKYSVKEPTACLEKPTKELHLNMSSAPAKEA
jgi:hypothetical protein